MLGRWSRVGLIVHRPGWYWRVLAAYWRGVDRWVWNLWWKFGGEYDGITWGPYLALERAWTRFYERVTSATSDFLLRHVGE